MKHIASFRPRLFETLRGYSRKTFTADLMAGVVVGIVALPLAIAFGIASGVSPEKGIITAIVAGFVISLLGGTKVQIGGPTGAFIVIVYGVVQEYGETGLLVATFMAGVLLVLMGLFKLGAVIRFIPYPVVVGFTAGIALTIFTTQIADLFGLDFGAEKIPGDFIGKWLLYFRHFESVNWPNLAVGIGSVLLIAVTPRFFRRIPGSLVAIIVLTAVVWALNTYAGVEGIDTIGDRFTIRAELPAAALPTMNWDIMRGLFPVALTIALLGAIESLLSATVADGVTGDRHDSNTELMAQGAANLLTPLFGGIPATGAIARTMTNINNGGKTPVAGIIHAVVLLLILLLMMPLAKYIPMACLAGVLVVVAYNMSGWRTFHALLKTPLSDRAVLLVTFFLTVIFDLTVAIEVGLLIACVLFLKRVMETTEISVIRNEIKMEDESGTPVPDEHLSVPEGVEVYEIDGPYFFGIATRFEELMMEMGDRARVRIIRMRRVPFIDSTGLYNLHTLCVMSQKAGIALVLSGVNPVVRKALESAGICELLGEENICPDIHAALARAEVVAILAKKE